MQATQFANYHVTDTSVFYQKQDFWQIPGDPTQPPGDRQRTVRPYYVLMKVPGDTTEHFWLILPFVPQGRQNMVAWMAADSDPPPRGAGTPTAAWWRPSSPRARTSTGRRRCSRGSTRIRRSRRSGACLDQGGSQVLFGDFLVIPVENSFLYVQPVYVRSSSAAQTTAVPELKRVIVANGAAIGVGNNLHEALVQAIAGQIPGGHGNGNGGGNGGGTGSVNQRISNLLQQALDHFAAAQAALRNGDLATVPERAESGSDPRSESGGAGRADLDAIRFLHSHAGPQRVGVSLAIAVRPRDGSRGRRSTSATSIWAL